MTLQRISLSTNWAHHFGAKKWIVSNGSGIMVASTTRRRALESLAITSRNVCSSVFENDIITFHPPKRLMLSSSSPSYFFHSCRRTHSTKINHDDPLRFEDLNLHPRTLEALKRQGVHKLTEIQERTYNTILKGNNVVARSRTGTGKTLAFLVPCIERILQSERNSGNNNSDKRIPILILAPTRELAAQINAEAQKIFSLHQKQHHRVFRSQEGGTGTTLLSSQVIFGGSSKKEDVYRFERQLPTILVATPGRLKDHLANTTLAMPRIQSHDSGKGGNDTIVRDEAVSFRSLFQGGKLETLILDETDRLLELGFRRDIQEILSCLHACPTAETQTCPTQTTHNRQTLLFSATLAPGIMDVVDMVMSTSPSDGKAGTHQCIEDNKSYQMVDCVHEEDPETHTNISTTQSYVVLPVERFWTGTLESILNFITTTKGNRSSKKKRNKVIVFFEMTRLAQLYSRFLTLRLGHTVGVWEIHGKMHQRERTMISRRFRNASHGMLLTSDVSARGVDYPDVSHVIQVGASQNRETYIHRLGRTGRAGKQGQGILIIPEPELNFVEDELKGLGIKPDHSLQQQLLSKNKKSPGYGTRKVLENELGMLRQDIVEGTDSTGMAEALHIAYHSLISYYFQTRRRLDTGKQSLNGFVALINQLVKDFGLPELPAIDTRRAKSMGIENLSDLNIRKNWEDHSWTFNANHDFQSKEHDNFDEWFGLSRGPELNRKKSTPIRTKHNERRRDRKG